MSFLVVTGIHAYGRIVRPSLINGTLYILVIPASYLAFKLGGNAWVSYLINLLAVIIGVLSNAYTLHKYIPLEKKMATHSRILAWEIPRERSLVGFRPWGHKRLGHNLEIKQQQ